MKQIDASCYAKRISPLDGEYLFGYYDLQPFNKNLHLTHKVPYADHIHQRGDRAEIGLLDIERPGIFEKLDTTGAWNFQQGAMLQWNPASPEDEILYNSITDDDYNATILNIRTGTKRYLDRPVANVSQDGRYALSINFARMYNFRPGYGYAEYGDPFYYKNHSSEDGVFLTDMQTGRSRLIVSMEQIWEFSHKHFGDADQKMVINHLTFNTDGSRFLMLVRNFPKPGQRHDTAIITANRDGSDLFMLSDYGVQSHYFWLDPEHVIFYSDGKELSCSRGWANNYILKDKTYEGQLVANGFFDQDNHMSFSPDRKWMLSDGYADSKRMQPLWLANLEEDIVYQLGRYYSVPRDITDLRCDLHPRWDQTGRRISFDSTHEGQHGVYVVDIEAFLHEYR